MTEIRPLPGHWRSTFRTFYPAWRVVREDGLPQDPEAGMAGDERQAGTVTGDGSGPTPSPVYRIWRNRRCLVATRRETRLPRFQEAAAASAARGWPVVTRISGGTMVPHLPESLHLSLLLPRLQGREPGTDEIYRFLAEPVREALGVLGVESEYGMVPRSFCDGRFNLVAAGKKLAGTSQRWTGGLPGHPVRPGFVLAHLTLFVAGDMHQATRAVNQFLGEAVESGGRPGSFDPGAAVTVAELLGPKPKPPEAKAPWESADLLRRVEEAMAWTLTAADPR
ncbi:MAG: lipoate--protein ligase family protein [Gemmatimonadales bacterium]|nr:MAG: lipoate--protein ligase family protein [Gemmatimonadales bacterium]